MPRQCGCALRCNFVRRGLDTPASLAARNARQAIPPLLLLLLLLPVQRGAAAALQPHTGGAV
jgi:hypothetical protein